MFGFFKKKPPAPSAPSAPIAAPVTPTRQPEPSPAPASPARGAAPRPEGATLEISLREILDGLPPELTALVAKRPGSSESIGVSLETIRAQLPSGAVRISFHELQSWAPPGIFRTDGSHADAPVTLPLKTILAKLPPSEFRRQAAPQKVFVPEEVQPIFGARGQILQAPSANGTPAPPPPAPAAPSAPLAKIPEPAPTPAAKVAPPAPAPVPPPAPAPVAAAPQRPTVPLGETISISMAEIAGAAPAELKALLPTSGDLLLPLSIATEQLPKGEVKVTLRNLQDWGIAGINGTDEQLNAPLSLPLKSILPKLPQSAFKRRAPAKTIEVPDEVKPLFAAGGLPAEEKPAAPPTAPVDEPKPEPVAEQKISFKPPADLARPSASTPAVPSGASIKPPAPPSATPAPAKLPGSTGSAALPTAAAIQPPRPAVPVPAAPAPIPAAPRGNVVKVEVSKVWEEWGEDVQRVFITFPEAALEIPAATLGEALKQGRVMFTWGELQPWIRPNIGSAGASVFDDTPLVLPLPVLAPLFIQARAGQSAQKRVAIPDTIPNLFESRGPGARPETAQTPQAAPDPQTPAPSAPVAAPPATSELGKVLGNPTKLSWTPQEIVAATTALAGVVGAVIATTDGLLVSAKTSPELPAEAVAAFVPQLFARVVQMNKELQFGDAAEATIHVGGAVIHAAPSGRNILIAIGKKGVPMPIDSLNTIAREIALK